MKNRNLSTNNLKLFLYLLLFWTLAFSQPLMTILGKQPEFLVAHEIRGWYLVILTLVLNLIIPLVLSIILTLLGVLSLKLKEILSRITILILLIFFIMPFFGSFSNNHAYLLTLSLSIILLYLFIKFEILKTYVLWFSPLCLVVMASFLFFSPANQLLPQNNTGSFATKSDDSSPVFLFLFDEFPLLSILEEENKINHSRFPNISKLLEESIWYKNATTISSATAMAIPSILSGIKPSSEEVRLATYEQYKDNLFTIMSQTHNINAIEDTSRMCPESLCKPLIKDPIRLLIEDVMVVFAHHVYPHKKRKKLPPINDRWAGYLREIKKEDQKMYVFSDRKNKFMSFVDSFEVFPTNTLHFLHILLPHAPWRLLPNESLYAFYESEGVAGTMEKNDPNAKYMHEWTDDAWAAELSWRRQLLQIGAVDSLLGKAINKIKSLGLYEGSTIIITADHGGAFIPGLSRRFAHDKNIADIAAVPLIIKYPNQKQGSIDNRFASNLDILPTLLELFSMNPKISDLDGMSLLSDNLRIKPTPIYQEGRVITNIPENYQFLIENHLNHSKSLLSNIGWDSVYNSNNNSKIGLSVDDLIINQKIENALVLQNENLFSDIRIDSKYIPAYYRLQSKIGGQNEILVAINGRIVSHCFMFKHSPNDCAGLINPKIYKTNDTNNFNFRFFSVITKENGHYRVNELLINSILGAQIEKNNDKEFIKFHSGRIEQIKNTQPYGSLVIKLTDNDSTYKIGGWAGNTQTGQPAEKIYVFVDNELLTTTQTGLKKPYLLKTYGLENLINSGFEVTIPVDQYRNIENHNIRVFASIGTNFIEVNYNKPKKNKNLFKVFNPKTNRKIPINQSVFKNQKIKTLSELRITEIDAFNHDFNNFSSGEWFSINNHTRWLGSNAKVMVPLKKGTDSITISMTAKPLTYPGKLENQEVHVSVNGKHKQTINFTGLSSHEIQIDLVAEDKTEVLMVSFNMPNSASPSDFSDSKDKRKLSLLLTDFKIKVNNKNDN